MSLRDPRDTGTPDGTELPTSILEFEVLVDFDHHPTLTPEEMAHVNLQVARRISAALHESNLFAGLLVRNAHSSWDVMQGRGANTPVFPIRVGEHTFLHHTDLVARVEQLCNENGIGSLGYDLAGRAYELFATIKYVRERAMDQARNTGTVPTENLYRMSGGADAEEIEEGAQNLFAELQEKMRR